MRGAIFIPAIAQTEWVREVLPGTSPAELPVAGRRFIDYLLEAAQRRGLDMAEVTDWHPSPRLADEFSSLTRTVIPVFYRDGAGDLPRGLDDIPAMQGPLSSRLEEGIVAVWGLVLPLHPPGETTLEPITPAERANTPPGIYRHTGDGWMRVSPHGFPARDVKSWFDLNMTVAETPCGFTLPGYSSEDGVHLGSNVVLERG
ncbi:MAG: hypothetical protein IJP66_07300, partial [Kiritimatiellae bacterium]|nr:hypothetical protein [Kiritimatiellia bacterium]